MRSSALVLAALVGLGAVAHADEADDLLQRVDRAIAPTTDKVWAVTMRIMGTDGEVREGKMLMLQGGLDKRILRFLAPAQMRNTALLAIGAHDYYVFLGQEGRTRRLGSSAMNQSFLGADFTFEDLGSIYFRDLYTPHLAGKSGDDTVLELLPKGDSSWSKLKLIVENHALVKRIEYYDKSGRHARTQTRQWRQDQSKYETWVPQRVLMVNELTHHATELLLQVADAEKTVPTDVFTLRGLQRGDDLHFAP
jgi:hypothetical protein